MKLRVLDLFSGIGGFSLGLERTGGFETVAFCEIEDYPRRVLAKHWPGVPIYDDVRTLTADTLRRDGIAVEVICGGFPCQDISFAGQGAGLAGERSGLWREYHRLIGELRPKFVIVENVAALLSRGLGDVLGDLAENGYDTEWHCIPASAIGAPHRRDRVWIIANTAGDGWPRSGSGDEQRCFNSQSGIEFRTQFSGSSSSSRTEIGAAPYCSRLSDGGQAGKSKGQGETIRRMALTKLERRSCAWWLVEPDVGRVANGVPSRVDRLKGLGNAVVPQIPEIIGNAILETMRQQT